jgi:hypothetical protein
MSGALILIANTVAGSNDSNVKIEVTGDKEFKIQVQNISGKAQIVLQEENGEVLYKEQINARTYEKRFDVTLLKKGNYVLRIEDDFKIQSTKINLSEEILAEVAELYFQPIVSQRQNIIMVSKIASGSERLIVRIYDENGILIYDDILKGADYQLGRRYDFSKVPKGVYNIYLASNGHSVNRRIDLR